MKLTSPLLIVLIIFTLAMIYFKPQVIERPAYQSPPPVAQGESVKVICDTSKGPLDITVVPEWSPLGAERFFKMVDDGYFSGVPFFRCMEKFVCQFGPKPGGGGKSYPAFPDDPKKPELRKFKPGYLSFAGFQPNSRAYHIFIALSDADSLGSQQWETPFGYVNEMSVVNQLYKGYGEMGPHGKGPEPAKIDAADGAQYLAKEFPLIDSFTSCRRK